MKTAIYFRSGQGAAMNSLFMGLLLVCCLGTTFGDTYYVANNAGTGSGTLADPFGLDDLPEGKPAVKALLPGDTLLFRAGHYQFDTRSDGSFAYLPYVRPTQSGQAGKLITFKAYPDEQVTMECISGTQPVFGTFQRDYLRFEGFFIEINAYQVRGFQLYGIGSEVGYCHISTTITGAAKSNFAGIFLGKGCKNMWVHHNVVRGFDEEGTANGHGIELYSSTDCIIEDNYCTQNGNGLYDKESGLNNIFRRNLAVGNLNLGFQGNNQGEYMVDDICDNVLEGISLWYHVSGTAVHDNLILGSGVKGVNDVLNTKIWNNLFVSQNSSIVACENASILEYMDYNLYNAEPRYGSLTLSQMQGQGFETYSQVMSLTNIFADTAVYEILPIWKTAGRYADAIGPDNMALVLDTTRYGPSGLGVTAAIQLSRPVARAWLRGTREGVAGFYDVMGRKTGRLARTQVLFAPGLQATPKPARALNLLAGR